MAKGQMKSNKEGKKPKSDKPKSSMSEYKKSQGASGQALRSAGQEILSTRLTHGPATRPGGDFALDAVRRRRPFSQRNVVVFLPGILELLVAQHGECA